MRTILGCCAVVRGTAILGAAVLLTASGPIRTSAAAPLAFGLRVRLRGLFSCPLPYSTFALFPFSSFLVRSAIKFF